MSAIYLIHHLGLGDHIICNSIIRELAEKHDKVIVPAKHHNAESVRGMFSDLENVVIYPIENYKEMIAQGKPFTKMHLGIYGDKWKTIDHFDSNFYMQAGIDFENRWENFKIGRNADCEYRLFRHYNVIPGEYTLVHNQHDNYKLNAAKIDNPTMIERHASENICNYYQLIENALEIHCIDSAFMFLVDSIPSKGTLFLHRYARHLDKFNTPTLRKNWNIIKTKEQLNDI